MKQVEVTILGQVYMLGCPEGGETLLGAAVASVDKEMTTIRDGGKVKARERIAVLAALNVAYQLAERVSQTPAASTRVHAPGDASGPSEVDLAALVRRIDDALGDDGHLL
jgi:cell division protein ZapA